MPPLDLIAWILIVGWAFLLLGSFWLGSNPARAAWMERSARLGSSLVLVILAWYGYILADGLSSVRYAGFIAAGMTLGFIGDLFMAKVLPAPNRVLGGMGAFGISHILYIVAVITYAPIGWIGWIVWLGIGALLAYFVVLRGEQVTVLHRAALIYALLLASTAGVATGLSFQQPLFTGLAVGAALFLVSDLLIAVDLFKPGRFPFLNKLVWLTYGPGQALIVTSIWSTFQP
jgi:hypothetical protein